MSAQSTRFELGAVYLIPLFAFSSVLLLHLPSTIGSYARYDLSSFVIISFILLFLVLRLEGRIGRVTSLSLVLILFALPLARLWQSGTSESFVIGGLMPDSDARGYYSNAKTLLNYGLMGAERPLFSGLLSVLLALTRQNLQIAIVLLVLISAIACYLAAREVRSVYGASAAAFVALSLLLYFRPFIGLVMTENLGFPLGVAGFTILWRGAIDHDIRRCLTGLFLLALGLNARVGAVFILPAIVIWGTLFFRAQKRFSLRFLGGASAAILLAFSLNTAVYKTVCFEAPPPFSNFYYTAYGMLTGTRWSQVYEDDPGLRELNRADRAKRIKNMTIEQFQKDPSKLALGMLRDWRDFFWSHYSIFVPDIYMTPNEYLRKKIDAIFGCLSAIGLLVCLSSWRTASSSLMIASALGVCSSAAFIPMIDASSRPYAPTMIVFSILGAQGLVFLKTKAGYPAVEFIRKFLAKQSLMIHRPFLIAGLLGLLSFPFWYFCLPDSNLNLQIKMASNAEFVRLYNDPETNPDAYQRIAINPQSSVIWHVKIEALRERNPKARDSQVWVLGIWSSRQPLDWEKVKISGDPWNFRESGSQKRKWAIADGKSPQTLEAETRGGRLRINFGTNLSSGIAFVTANGQSRRIDLFGQSGIQSVEFSPVVAGDGTVRIYHLKIPASSSDHLRIVPEGEKDILVQEVKAENRIVLRKNGEDYVLPFRLPKKFHVALVLTFLSIIVSVHLLRLHGKESTGDPDQLWQKRSQAIVIFGVCLAYTAIVGPLAIKTVNILSNHSSSLVPCPFGQEIGYFMMNPGSKINLVSDNSLPHTNVPNVRISDFLNGLDTFSPWLSEEKKGLEKMAPGMTIVDVVADQFLIADTTVLPKTNGYLWVCGNVENYGTYLHLFRALSVAPLN